MAELVITDIGDTWINGASGRQGENYGDTDHVQLLGSTRYALLKPSLPNLAGQTVLDAYLVARSRGTLAQTITMAPVTKRWQPGRVKWKDNITVNAAAAVSRGLDSAADGETVVLGGLAPMLQAVADGTDWFGLRLATSVSSTRQRFYASDSGEPAFELHITVSDLAEPPIDLRPDGGAVSSRSPIVAWSADGQLKYRVQVDTPAVLADPDEVAPDYDSGWVTSEDPQHDLAGVHTVAATGAHYWRVQVESEGATGPSDWSDWADFHYVALPSLVVDSPTGPFGDPSPTVEAHLSSGTLEHWRVTVTGPDRADVRVRSGLQTGDLSFKVPESNGGRRTIVDGGWIYIEASDGVDRAVAVGDPGFASVWVPIVVSDDVSVSKPANLRVTQLAEGDPRHRWTWTRTEAADAWVLQVDGQNFEIIDAEDIDGSSGVYSWVDSGQVSPLRPHALSVRALDDGKLSKPVTVHQSHTVSGVWLLPDDADPIQLAGTAVGGFANSSRYARYEPLVGPPVDVIYDPNPGRMGVFSGSVDAQQDVWAAVDAIEALRLSRRRFARLVWGSQSIRCRIVDPDVTSADTILPNNLEHDTRFGFVEIEVDG